MQKSVTEDKPGPDSARVATRALTLGAVVARGFLERDEESQEAEAFRLLLYNWCDGIGLVPEFEEDELSLIACPVGALAPQQAINAQWRGEGLLVLAWSLGLADFEAYDELCNSAALASRLGVMKERSDTVLKNPIFRPRSEIESWANTYLTLHWRLRQHEVDLKEHGPRRIDLADYVALTNWGPLTIDNIRLVDGDISIGGRRIDCTDEDSFFRTLSIVRERHKALNWLRGDEPLYSEVGTPT
jgi:hypothetical protein